MTRTVAKHLFVVIGALLLFAAPLAADWEDTFDNGDFDLSTWEFLAYPDLTGSFLPTIADGPGDNDYLILDETNSVGVGGAAFGMAMGDKDDVFTDVRLAAVINVAGEAYHNIHGLGARTTYWIDTDGSMTGAPGFVASAYVVLINYSDGPTQFRLEVQKVVNLQNIMENDIELQVPGYAHGRSYYVEMDVVGTDPTYVTVSMYEYKDGPLVLRLPTMVDSSGQDPWEEAVAELAPFPSGVSGIFGMNEDPEPAGFHTTFDSVISTSYPSAVNISPGEGAVNVPVEDPNFDWVEADFATGRELWFGPEGNMQKIVPAPTGMTFTPPETLKAGTTYTWRVDQIGPGGTYQGHTWTFTTEAYQMIDDFDSYTDDVKL